MRQLWRERQVLLSPSLALVLPPSRRDLAHPRAVTSGGVRPLHASDVTVWAAGGAGPEPAAGAAPPARQREGHAIQALALHRPRPRRRPK